MKMAPISKSVISIACFLAGICCLTQQTATQDANLHDLNELLQDIQKRSPARDEEYYPEDEYLEDVADRWRLEPMDLLLQFNSRKRRDAIKNRNLKALTAAEAAAAAAAETEDHIHGRFRRADGDGRLTKEERKRLRAEFREKRKEQRKARRTLRRQARQRAREENNNAGERRRSRKEFREALQNGEEAVLERMLNMDIDMEMNMASLCERYKDHVPNPDSVVCNPEDDVYRKMDGSCNHPDRPTLGKTLEPLARWLPAEYSKHGQWLPRRYHSTPRADSIAIADIDDGSDAGAQPGVSILIMHWGQFTDHDITHTPAAHESCDCQSLNSSCFPLKIPPSDPSFTAECFEIPRSLAHCGDVEVREQFNEITPFIDASNVYGSTEGEVEHLRFHSDEAYTAITTGRMRVQEFPAGAEERLPLLPHQPQGNCHGERGDEGIVCGEAGDFRANEQPGLTSLHTIFVRLHNVIAEKLLKLNPHWIGENERVFQEARKIVGSVMQSIDYNEYLPTILGPDEFDRWIGDYSGTHDKNADPTISNVFATAGYRQGHSAVDNVLHRYRVTDDNGLIEERLPDLKIADAFFNAELMYDFQHEGIDGFIQGMVRQNARKIDLRFVETLLDKLFVTPNKTTETGLDLCALNILRGRDNGIAPYTKWRQYCNLSPINDWFDLRGLMSPATIEKLKVAYGFKDKDVENIDPFAGFMAEEPQGQGATLGPTLSCIIGTQFRNLRDGDRFFYQNQEGPQKFSQAQRNAIDNVSMARVLCSTLDNPISFQRNVFKLADKFDNPLLDCFNYYELPRFDLSPWCEDPDGSARYCEPEDIAETTSPLAK